ncbi:ATP-binding protein [Hymenobacter puniceus]|uniref:ATP-binding protein n=1 Tax=Hymenobacter sp. BT190 TaxID=2763505 RepID=UPI001651781A|nr:ATP-binding protein [Hymenobacter sp. BT190]MBC6699708.1 tetratricopeptide repeat protein [Hymenobacter sp. BT190]
MIRLLSLCLLLLAGFAAPAIGWAAEVPPSTTEADLLRRLVVQPLDTGRVRLLSALCYELHDSDPTRALRYGEQAVTLATTLNDQVGQLYGLLNLSSCYANLSDGPHALRLQQQALTLARQLHDANGIVRAYTGIGGIHHERSDTVNALRNYQWALEKAYAKGVKTRTQLMLFGNLGNLYSYLGRYPQALLYTRRALQLARSNGDKAGESLYMAHLGTHYYQQNRLDLAEGLLREAIVLVEPLRSYRIEAGHLEMLAIVLLLKDQLDEAETLTRRALRLARQTASQERLLDGYNLMAEINASRNNYEQAFGWQSRFRDLNDSLNSRSRLQTLAALQTRYETQGKEHQIKLLTQQGELQNLRNQELWAVVGALVLGLGGVFFLYWKLRQSRAALAANNVALHQATRELREVAASKDRLYAVVAHDLRGPVTSFVGVTELIEFYLRKGDETGLRRLPALVKQSANSLNSLLDNLLSWAVNQTGELVSQPEWLSVDELFTEIEELYRTTAEAKQIQLVASDAPGLQVWSDLNMTRTILRNLVGNALKFTPSGGHIQLDAATTPDNSVLLTIADSGRGMPAEQLDALLRDNASSPMMVAASTNNARSGTGLGLPLCRAFVERLHGTLTVESTLGQGTVVQIRFPARPAA